MTRVKICGITNLDDLRAAVELGADALGFIRVPESPRYVPDDLTAELLSAAPPFVTRVGVYRRPPEAKERAQLPFDAIQFYEGDAAPDPAVRHIRAYRVSDAGVLDEIERTHTSAAAILLDGSSAGRLGGSGATFDWAIAEEARRRFGKPLILAGGLTPDNVAEAIRRVQPYAVDVASGVESSPGCKDRRKLREFVEAVRSHGGV